MIRQLLIAFLAESRFESLRQDLSAIHLTPDGHLWLASDELLAIYDAPSDGRLRMPNSVLADLFTIPGSLPIGTVDAASAP